MGRPMFFDFWRKPAREAARPTVKPVPRPAPAPVVPPTPPPAPPAPPVQHPVPDPDWASVPVALWSYARLKQFQDENPNDYAVNGQLAYAFQDGPECAFAFDWWPSAYRATGRYYMQDVLLAAKTENPRMYCLMLHEFDGHIISNDFNHPIDGQPPYLRNRFFHDMEKSTEAEREAARERIRLRWGAVDVTLDDNAGRRYA